MNARTAWIVLFAGALAAGCDGQGIGAPECATMPVKGWDELLSRPAFAGLAHRKDIVFDPLSETSRLLVADSSFDYDTLLTFVFAHPSVGGKPPGADTGRCIRDASLTLRLPLDAHRTQALSQLESFLQAKGIPAALTARLDAVRAMGAAFSPVAPIAGGRLSAGVGESGARARFFRVEVASPAPGAQSKAGGAGR